MPKPPRSSSMLGKRFPAFARPGSTLIGQEKLLPPPPPPELPFFGFHHDLPPWVSTAATVLVLSIFGAS